MRILRDLGKAEQKIAATAVAIGNFDGFHKGHQAVIQAMLEKARERHLTPSVLTFEPHPRMFFKKAVTPLRIEPFHLKAKRLRDAGVELLVVLRFNTALSEMTAERFVDGILIHQLNVNNLITGENFMFGKGRTGDSAFLRKKASGGAFDFTAIDPVYEQSVIASSTQLRESLTKGAMDQAAELLGRPYEIDGRVVHGDGRGKQMGIPTANIRLGAIYEPRRGVYAVRYRMENNQTWYHGVANFGVRPTFGGTDPVLEIHGLDGAKNLYGERLRVQWLHFIREEIAFPDTGALQQQIANDVHTAKHIFREWRHEQA